MFVPFEDHDKVLEVRVYEPRKESVEQDPVANEEQAEERREEFLQERYDFLDKIKEHESQLKKNFSEKVYSLLKELKNRNPQETRADRDSLKSMASEDHKSKNELDFKNRLADPRRKEPFSDPKLPYSDPKLPRFSPPKHKLDHELLIHSVHAKPDYRFDRQDNEQLRNDPDLRAGFRQIKEDYRGEKLESRAFPNYANLHPAFGGMLNPYLGQFANY